MEDIVREIAVEVPVLACFIVVSWLFLRALKESRDVTKDIAKDFADAMREHTEEGKKLRETLGAHSEVIRRCQQVIAQQ